MRFQGVVCGTDGAIVWLDGRCRYCYLTYDQLAAMGSLKFNLVSTPEPAVVIYCGRNPYQRVVSDAGGVFVPMN